MQIILILTSLIMAMLGGWMCEHSDNLVKVPGGILAVVGILAFMISLFWNLPEEEKKS